MPGISALRSAIPFHKGTGVVWIDADIVSASVEYAEPTKVLINFSYNLDATSTPAPSAFTLAGKTITDVTVGGGQIVLTVSVAYEYGDIITVDYTVPATNRLKQNITGYVLNSWTGQAVANYVNEEDVATYVDGLATTLSDTQLGYINTILTNYKSDEGLTNLSDAYDVMYYLGNETAESSLRNLVKRAHDAVAVNSPTFTPYEGWQGDGISSYVDTNYNPATQGVNFAVGDASYGFYSRTTGSGIVMAPGLANTRILFYLGNRIYWSINGAAPDSYHSYSDANGMYVIGGDNVSNKSDLYRNKIVLDTTTGSQATVENSNFWLLGRGSYYSTKQLAFAFAGNHRTQTSVNYLTDRFEALMDSNGKGVL